MGLQGAADLLAAYRQLPTHQAHNMWNQSYLPHVRIVRRTRSLTGPTREGCDYLVCFLALCIWASR